MKEFLAHPGFLAPYGTRGTDMSYLLAIAFTGLFMVGWYRARRGQGQSHHVVTLWAMLAMLAYFTWYYLSRELGVLAFEGKEGFGGPASVYTWVFSPLLTIHITVVAIGIVLALYMIALGFRTSVRRAAERTLRAGPPIIGSGRFSLGVFGASLVTAVALFAVRAASKGPSLRLFIAWTILSISVGLLVIAFEWIGRALFADGERRHRALGSFTMVLYLVALVTSTATYVMLYFIWPPKIGTG